MCYIFGTFLQRKIYNMRPRQLHVEKECIHVYIQSTVQQQIHMKALVRMYNPQDT